MRLAPGLAGNKSLESFKRRFPKDAVCRVWRKEWGVTLELLSERKKFQLDQKFIHDLLSLTSSKTYPLDLKASKEGKISEKWRIIINAGITEI
jgi:hypothetical protein